MYINRRYRIAVWAISAFVAATIISLILSIRIYFPSAPYFVPLNQKINNGLALGLIIALTCPAIIEFNNSRWLRKIDVNAPRLLMDVTESVKSGIPLHKALEDASKLDYGPISRNLEMAMVKFHLTSDLKGSLEWMGKRLIRPSMKRIGAILIEAHETGGDIINVLDTSVDIFKSLAEYQEERNAQTKPYTFIVYLGTIIFLVISWLMLAQFLAPLVASTENPVIEGSNVIQTLLDIQYYKSILFWAAIMEAIFGGLVAGKISEGRISAGVVHSVVLLSITIAFFNLFNV